MTNSTLQTSIVQGLLVIIPGLEGFFVEDVGLDLLVSRTSWRRPHVLEKVVVCYACSWLSTKRGNV